MTNEFVSALRAQIRWLSFGAEMNPFQRWNPIRPLVHWYYTRLLDRYMGRELEHRLTAHQDSGETGGAGGGRSKTVIDLALDKYLEEQPNSKATRSMDATFKKFAISQMKVFVLAGHDTTSSTLCYIFHLLSSHPLALQRVRAEHDEIFGSDPSQAEAAIIENPHALKQLPFTVAVIKEAMRLFPAASSTRNGEPGFSLVEDGREYPTDGCIVWSLHQAIHREPLYWPEPDTFIPERWLVPKGDPLYPVKGAWRGFEFGPRNCIGQELAMLEIKIVMVMTLREFNIKPSYGEWDQVRGKPGPRTVSGERAYQVLNGTTRPADGFPCRVTRISH